MMLYNQSAPLKEKVFHRLSGFLGMFSIFCIYFSLLPAASVGDNCSFFVIMQGEPAPQCAWGPSNTSQLFQEQDRMHCKIVACQLQQNSSTGNIRWQIIQPLGGPIKGRKKPTQQQRLCCYNWERIAWEKGLRCHIIFGNWWLQWDWLRTMSFLFERKLWSP